MNQSEKQENITIFFSGDEYFQAIYEAIGKAHSEVLIESYIFDYDPIGLRILKELAAAKNRGVKTRLLVDGVGSFTWINKLVQESKRFGLELRIYHPIPLELKLISILSWKNLKRILFFFRRINKRNHRKTVLIDNHLAFLGSFNISQVHSETHLAQLAWRDTGVMLNLQDSPKDFHELREAFYIAWRKSRPRIFSKIGNFFKRKKTQLPSINKKLFRLNTTRKLRSQIKRDLINKIFSAEKQILITNAYFLPRPRLIRSLIAAAQRGVYVGLCLPGKTDVWFVREASRYLYHRMLKAGIHIFEYEPRVLHAKTLIIDNWGTIGSQNFNHRSLLHDLEVEVAIRSESEIAKLMLQWEKDISESKIISIEEINKTSLLRRFLSQIIYWFRYWI